MLILHRNSVPWTFCPNVAQRFVLGNEVTKGIDHQTFPLSAWRRHATDALAIVTYALAGHHVLVSLHRLFHQASCCCSLSPAGSGRVSSNRNSWIISSGTGSVRSSSTVDARLASRRGWSGASAAGPLDAESVQYHKYHRSALNASDSTHELTPNHWHLGSVQQKPFLSSGLAIYPPMDRLKGGNAARHASRWCNGARSAPKRWAGENPRMRVALGCYGWVTTSS